MKNFTNNFKQFTSRLSARWLIMALMLLVGISSAWADGFFEGLKVGYYPGTGNVDIWTGYNTSDIGTLSGQPYLKGVSVKTWGDNVTSVSIEIKNGNTTLLSATNATKKSEWNNGNQVNWNKEWELLTNIALPKTSGAHAISVIAKTNNGTTVTYTLTYSIPCDNVDDSQIRIEIASATSYTKVYAWYDSNSELLGRWSGTAMTTNGTSDINGQTVKYIIIRRNSVSLDKSVNIIFNNGGSSQSGNITGLKWGNIYYFDKNGGNMESKCLEPACETPEASDFTYTEPNDLTYSNSAKSATVVWEGTQGGNITVKYSSSSTKYTQAEPKDVGTYYVYVTTTEANGMCGVTDLYIGKSFTITKANQTTPTITANSTNICGKEATFAVSGGESTGDYSYTLDKNDANATREGTTLKATKSGSVTLRVKKLGDTNYNDSDEAVKEFNFTMPIENVTLTKVNDSKTTYCVGDRAEFKLTYSGPYPTSYAWSGTAMGSLEATGKTAKVLDNGASWYIDFSEAKTYTIALSLTGCNTDASDELSFTVNALPSAPTFTTNSAQVCSGVAFNLNEKFPRNSGEAGTLTWYKASDNSQVSDPTSVTITELTSYYAKATNNNCTSDKSLDCTVNVDTKPTLELASTPTVCPNVEIDLDNYATNTGTLTWYSNQERTTVITDGLVTPTERTTYYAKVTNGTCNPVENEFTVDVYGIADEMPAYTSTPATSCNGTPNSDGIITLKNPMGGVTYALDGTNGTGWSDLAAGTHKLSATVDACSSLTKVWDVNVEVENITPTATVSITGESSFCEGDNTELTCEVETTGVVTAYQWYNGDNLIQGATESTYTAKAAGSYKVVVTVKNKGCEDTFNATKEVSVKNKPTTPEFNPDFTSICVGGSTTLASGYSWYTDLNASALANLTVSPQTETTYYAIKEESGCSSDAGTFTVKVNPLPRITAISVNNSTPVINEDVLLTVEGSDIETVEWSITSGNNASLSDASGNSVKLSSTVSDAVTVTAKAISAYGCETTLTKEVTFIEEEDCTPIISKDIQITFYHPSTYNEYNSQKGQWWGMGTMYYSTDKKSWLTKDMGDATSGSKTVTIQNITSEKLYVYFESKWTYHVSNKASTIEDIEELTRGNRYDIRITNHGNDNVKATSEATYTGSLSTPAPLSAPAVKTVSATSEEGSGVVKFTGQIIKTGCAATSKIYYGYQFKKADEEWPTTGVEASNTPVKGKLIPLTNASETALYYQFSADVENLEDVDYHFRAYIINGYDFTNGNYDQGVYYGLDKLVTVSTVQTAVKTAEIELVNQDGTSKVEPGHKYCVGETGYIKVTSDVKYSTATWKSDLGVEVEQIGKTNIYQFEVKGKDQIVVLLSNKHNTEPVSSEPLEVDVYASPSVPEIALGASSICDTNEDGTTLTVTRTKAGQYYALYKEDGNGGIEVEDYQLCSTDNAEIKYTGLKEAAKYFVKTYRGECDSEITRSSSATLTVVDSKDVKISIEPTATETTPWMPVKLTVTATSDYTVTSDPNDAVINISGNIVKVKLPLPTEGVQNKGTTEDGVNVTFENVPYTITAALKTTGDEANPCAQPAIANITLTPYIEICD